MDYRKELLNALAVIQKACIGTDCDECPLRSDPNEYANRCMLRVLAPDCWELNTKDKWRAFI